MLDNIITSLKPKTKPTLQSVLNFIDDNDLKSINVFDFHTFDKILRKRYYKNFSNETEYSNWKSYLLSCIKTGDCLSICVSPEGGRYKIVDGYARAIGHLVCGIEANVMIV